MLMILTTFRLLKYSYVRIELKVIIILLLCYWKNCCNAVDIITAYTLDDRRIRVRVPVGSLGLTQPHIQWVWGEGSFPEGKET
jgi:hypothetical protein